jgi:hypothetical protein
VSSSGRAEGIRKRRVSANMVDVFRIHIRKYKNETCQNCSKEEGGEEGRMMEGVI